MERSPFTGLPAAAQGFGDGAEAAAGAGALSFMAEGGGGRRGDPVGLVPLARWDVEGWPDWQATEARFGAFLPGVERFDAQVGGAVVWSWSWCRHGDVGLEPH